MTTNHLFSFRQTSRIRPFAITTCAGTSNAQSAQADFAAQGFVDSIFLTLAMLPGQGAVLSKAG